MRALVTLTTDFGLRDSYVAQLKGVLYRRGPSSIEVIDLSHEIQPQNLREAALFVRAAWPQFPPGTIHLVVVDPGVGSARLALAAQRDGQFMLGPDNGVLPLGAPTPAAAEVTRAIDVRRLGGGAISATFHGRDVFAPAAALLAQGQPLAALGDPVDDWITVALPSPRRESAAVRGEVIQIDRFGNLISNLTRADLRPGAQIRLSGGPPLPLVSCYAEAEPGTAVALIGSSEWLEIAVQNASAQLHTGAKLGDPVSIEFP